MREPNEVRVGDLIEFPTQPTSSGIITNMMGEDEEEFEVCMVDEQHRVKALVVHQASDKKFAVWETANLPRFHITPRGRRST